MGRDTGSAGALLGHLQVPVWGHRGFLPALVPALRAYVGSSGWICRLQRAHSLVALSLCLADGTVTHDCHLT